MNFHSPQHRGRAAFTLVELLVVIGIIALLVGILLPTLSRARDSARSVACGSNLRSIAQAANGYVVANNGSLPWGYAFAQGVPYRRLDTSFPAISVHSLLTDYMEDPEFGELLPINGAGTIVLPDDSISPVFRCPEIGEDEGVGPIHYAQNPTAMPDAAAEFSGVAVGTGTPGGQVIPAIRSTFGYSPFHSGPVPELPLPAKISQMFPDNAIFWDTPTFRNLPTFADEVYLTSYSQSYIDNDEITYWSSYGTSASPAGLGQRTRYRDVINLPTDDGEYAFVADDEPVFFYKEFPAPLEDGTLVDLANGPHVARVSSASATSVSFSYFIYPTGNLRFRHRGERQCNTAFVDGSVQGLTWNPSASTRAGDIYADNEFKRAFYRIKKPSNVTEAAMARGSL